MSRRTRFAPQPRPELLAGVVALQTLAVAFFVLDAAGDVAAEGVTAHVAAEALAALALLAGVAVGLLQLRGLLAADRRKTAALAVAAGALSEVIVARARVGSHARRGRCRRLRAQGLRCSRDRAAEARRPRHRAGPVDARLPEGRGELARGLGQPLPGRTDRRPGGG